MSHDTPPTLDNAFLEYVWRLLIQDQEIRVDEDNQYENLTSAEAEANHGPTQMYPPPVEGPRVNAPAFTASTLQAYKASSAAQKAPHVRVLEAGAPGDKSAGLVAQTNSEDINQWNENDSSTRPSEIFPAQPTPGLIKPTSDRGIRLFTSESRIWRTIAGHEPDYTRIPGLDFICLSIIAACGPRGIPQNDLVRISGQDKRSLPMRTDRLHKNGYIIKRPVTIIHNNALMHTSLLTLKRFAESSEATAVELTEAANKVQKATKSKKRRSTTNICAPDQGGRSEPGVAISQRGLQVSEDGAVHGTPMPDLVTQWTPNRNLWNQIFDVVHQSGVEGTTLNGISMSLMGPKYKKPMEDLLAKLTNSWQLSQPLHLRHLAIVRDSVQKCKTSVYIYYAFEEYRKLVDAGQKTWEAVLMLQGNKKKNIIGTAFDAHPELDEDGFPKLDSSQFQGRHNNASLIECVPVSNASSKIVDLGTLRRSKVNDRPETTRRRTLTPFKPAITTTSTGRRTKNTAVLKGVGRPRKYPTTGIPADIESWNIDDIKGLIESRRMYETYQKTKITDEIQRRTHQGEESSLVAHELLEATDALRREQGEQPMSRFLVMQILHEYAGGAKPLHEDNAVTKLRNMLKEAEVSKYPGGKWPRIGRSPSLPLALDNGRSLSPHGDARPAGLDSVGTRARRPPKIFDQNPILCNAIVRNTRVHKPQKTPKAQQQRVPYWHLPSVAANSQLHHHMPLPHEEMRAPNKQTFYWHLPSIAAHSKPHYRVPVANIAVNRTWTTNLKTKKRGRPRKITNANAESTIEMPAPKRQKTAASGDYNSVTTTIPAARISSPFVRMHGTSQSSTPAYKPSPSMMHTIMFEKYEKVVNSVFRPFDGVFVTKTAQRYRRRDDPTSMTSIKYQVAIFKLAALNDLDWFAIDHHLTLSATSNYHQRSEQTARMEESNLGAFKSPSLKNLPSSVENSSSEGDNSLRDQHRATNPQHRELSDSLEEDSDDTAATLVTAHSSAIPQARRQTRPTTTLVTAKQASPNVSRPQFSNLHPARARPRLGTFLHKGPPPLMRLTASNHNELPRTFSNASSSSQTSEAPITTTNRDLYITSSPLGAGPRIPISKSRPDPHVSEDMSNHSAPAGPIQDPAHFIFKFPGLQNLDWFRHGQSQEEKESHPSPRDQEEGEAPVIESGPSYTSYYKAPTREEQRLAVINHSRTFRKGRVFGTSGRTGGSTAILRRDIVIHLVQKCGGVFPEASAMRVPFGHEWKARGQSGLPERKTVVNAVNMCCEQGKLRRIVFSFKDCRGITATSTIFALPDIDSGDSRVRKMQEMVKKRHPQTLVPDVVMPNDATMADLRKTKRQQTLIEAAEKQARVDEARTMALKSPAEREAYLTALQSSDCSEQEKTVLSRLTEPSTRSLQRLATIKKPAERLLPLPASTEEQANEIILGKQPSSISQDYALSEATVEVGRPSDHDLSRILRPRKEQVDDFSIQSEQSRQRMRGLAGNAAQIERRQRSRNQANLYLQHSDFKKLPYAPQEYVISSFMGPMIEKHEASGTFSTSFSGTQIAKVPSQYPTRSRKRKRLEIEEQIFPGFMDPILMYHRATGTFSATFPGFRIGMIKLNLRGKRKYNPKAAVPLGYQSPFPHQQLDDRAPNLLQEVEEGVPGFPGVMSPNTLHSSSGTFSVNFLGFRPGNTQVVEAGSRRGCRRSYLKRTKTAADVERFNITEDPRGYKRKRHRTDSIAEGSESGGIAEPSPDPLIGRPFKLRRVRGPQTAKTLGQDGALRLSIAVMVVRILTGGIRMTIDWTLVAKVFVPVHDENFVQSRWSSVLTQMRHNQVKMDTDFQALFARAYEQGAVPKIDFEHLGEYDWKWLVEWTMAHLDTPSNSAPELLVDRASFNQHYTFKDSSQEKDLAHFYEFEGFSVKELRKSVINRQAYVCHLFPRYSPPHASEMSSENGQIAIARSWIRANIITPFGPYDPQAARTKLDTIPVATVKAALKSLHQEKVIIEKNKSRIVPSRDYEFSDYFEKRLRTNISPAQFHRAVVFKAQLDQAIETEGRARWSYLAHDGDAMALLNLVSNKRVKIVPIDPPLNKWGHTDHGYASRQMDKSKLNFEVEIIPTSIYTVGSPLKPLPPPPAPHLNAAGQQLNKIPLWYDINDDLVSRMWTPVLAAVLGLLAIRPGATAEELQINIRPSLEVWEVKEVLQWMVEAEVAQKVSKEGFRTKEWWWMALGESSEVALVDDGYKLGFASMTDKPKPSRRRYHRAEEQEKRKLENSSRIRTRPRNTMDISQAQEEDAMEIE